MSAFIRCLDCRKYHRLPDEPRQALASARLFEDKHPLHRLDFAVGRPRRPEGIFSALRHRALGLLGPSLHHPALEPYWQENADIKLAYQAGQSMTVTGLNSLASSLTAGWGSAEQDNTANLFLDALVQFTLNPANTAPGSAKSFSAFAYHRTRVAAKFATTGAATGGTTGSEGALTFPDISANPQNLPFLGIIPYVSQDVVIGTAAFSIALTAGGVLPPHWGVALLNVSGAALQATGNSVQFNGVYATV